MTIKRLDKETVEKIAAGEVIQRPASVIKELVDNAIDSAATIITVEVEDRAEHRLVVSDNGHGMTAEELPMAVDRHTTSKISRGSDLFDLKTMGFRGEALASIGAVSTLTITTRTQQDIGGNTLVVKGGDKGDVESAASSIGTKIVVEDLFFNTPARKKFLRKAGTEYSAIAEVVHQQLLAWPSIRFKLVRNGKVVLQSPGNGDKVDAIASLVGTEIADNLLPCDLTQDGYSIQGYVATPNFHRSNKALQFFTVNRRPVYVPVLGSALAKAFHTLLPVNRHPIAFLDLTVPNEQVDVNVHPAKREVKFSQGSTVFRLILNACMQAFSTEAPLAEPEISAEQDITVPEPAMPTPTPTPEPLKRSSFLPRQTSLPPAQRPNIRDARQMYLETNSSGQSQYNVLGQVFSSFIVVATPQELRLVDQHAAQERVRYEKFVHMLRAGQKPSQVVLPMETPLSGRDRQFIETHQFKLAELGFKLELTEQGMIIKEVPIIFNKMLSSADVSEIVDGLQQYGTDFSLEDYSQAAMMLLACKGAIKANHKLSNNEALQLLIDLDECDNNRTCPHGRPIWITFDRVGLEKLFARR